MARALEAAGARVTSVVSEEREHHVSHAEVAALRALVRDVSRPAPPR